MGNCCATTSVKVKRQGSCLLQAKKERDMKLAELKHEQERPEKEFSLLDQSFIDESSIYWDEKYIVCS